MIIITILVLAIVFIVLATISAVSNKSTHIDASPEESARLIADDIYVDNMIVKKIALDRYAYFFIPRYKHNRQAVGNDIAVKLYTKEGDAVEILSSPVNSLAFRVDAANGPVGQGGSVAYFSYSLTVDGHTFEKPQKQPITLKYSDETL